MAGNAATDAVPALEMRGVTKRFPGVLANDHIDLDLRRGEIHALLGENGAGKTTLMNILYGLLTPDEGEILLGGKPVTIASPADAIAQGISMVHQHFMLVPVLTVAENILLGEEPMANPVFLDRKAAHTRIRELGRFFGTEIDPDTKVGTLSVGWQQRVEILKALYRSADILVLDEPTAVLTPQETREIFTVLRRLTAEGTSIIFISHKLYEVLEIADRITVIRRGKVVGRAKAGRDGRGRPRRDDGRPRGAAHRGPRREPPAEPTLVVERPSRPGRPRPRGAARRELRGPRRARSSASPGWPATARTSWWSRSPVFAILPAGRSRLDGHDVTGLGARALHDLGVGFVPADRHRFGLVLTFPLTDNLVLTDYYHPPYARGLVRNEDAIREHAEQAIGEFDVRTPSSTRAAGTLSGGNQQKVIVAREFEGDLKLLILDQPTRGLDVGSIEFIHRRTIEKRDAGAAILLVSAELDEVLELADRIGVMYRGKLVAILDGRTATREEVGLLMATGGREGAA